MDVVFVAVDDNDGDKDDNSDCEYHLFIIIFQMPNGVILSDLYYTEGESIFKLLEPLDERNYTCYWDVDDACRSRLGDWVTESVLYVHKFQIHQILQEG